MLYFFFIGKTPGMHASQRKQWNSGTAWYYRHGPRRDMPMFSGSKTEPVRHYVVACNAKSITNLSNG